MFVAILILFILWMISTSATSQNVGGEHKRSRRKGTAPKGRWKEGKTHPYFKSQTFWAAGGNRGRTGDLSDCSRLLYHWAIPPQQVHLQVANTRKSRLFILYFEGLNSGKSSSCEETSSGESVSIFRAMERTLAKSYAQVVGIALFEVQILVLSILWCRESGDNPQEDLLGYKLNVKVLFEKTSPYIFQLSIWIL